VLGLPLEEVSRCTTENACHLFRLGAASGARSSSRPTIGETLTTRDV